MTLEKFIFIVCGDKSLALCLNLAMAHTNLSISEIKSLINNLYSSKEFDFPKPFWVALRREILKIIKDNKADKDYLDNLISEILMEFKEIAPYFISTEEHNMGESVNKLFNCIVETYQKAIANRSTASYEEILSSSEATSKWSRESLQAIAKIGTALRKFANLLQGCIYANGLKDSVSDYQKLCGVSLATEFTNKTIADATYWTKTYTENICKWEKAEVPTNTPLRSILAIPELDKARTEGLINNEGTLLVSISKLVMHFYENKIFLPLTVKAFKPIDSLLKTEAGMPITAKKLSRGATDLQKNCYIDRKKRYDSTIP